MISVIVPMYNRENTIAKTLDSIYASDYKDFEVIIVDDGSTDSSVEIAKKYPCDKIIRLSKNKGAGAARNVGAKSAEGDILLFIDSDVIIGRDTLQKIAESKADATVGTYSYKSVYKNPSSLYKSAFLYLSHRSIPRFWTGCGAIKKEIFKDFQFDESEKDNEDTELGMRLVKNGYRINVLKDVQVIHNHKYNLFSLMRNDVKKGKNLLKTLAKKRVNIDYARHFKKFFIKDTPEQVTLFVTNKCNCKCKHCFVKNLNKNEKELTLEEIEQISRGIPKFTYLLLGGGEPFMRKDLDRIVNTFYVNNNVLNTSISTNGYYTEHIVRTVKEILSKYNHHLVVNVSIDGIGKSHNEIRNAQVFDKAVKTIEELKKIKNKNFNVGVIITMSPFNQDKLKDIYSYVKNLGVDSISLNYMRGIKMDMDIKNYDEMQDIMKNDLENRRIKGFHSFLFSRINVASKIKMRKYISRTVKEGYQMPCYAGKLNCVITNTGKLYPCEMLEMCMGDLRKESFKKIWNSPDSKKIREFIKKSKCYCTEECNVNMNMLFSLNYAPKIIRDAITI